MTHDFADTIAAASRGDAEAISRLYRENQARLLRVLRLEVGDAADDVASQTWLEVVGNLSRFRGDEAGFRGLLFTVARRRVADHRRSQRRRPATPTEPGHLVDRAAPQLDVETIALASIDADDAIRMVVDLLTPDQAEVVLLRVVAGLPVEEVARMLGRPSGTIRVQQHRALKRLAQALQAPAPGNDGVTSGDWERG